MNILTEEEKTYLENLIGIFEDRVTLIYKEKFNSCEEMLNINYDDYGVTKKLQLPIYESKKYFKGMELCKKYTLKDLGLFEDKKND